MMNMQKLLILLVSAFISFTSFAQKYEEPVYTVDGLAIKGYDAVAYFTENKQVKGSGQYAYEWQGSKWLFASKTNLNLFKSDTEKYLPQYGGYCAWGMKNGYKAKIEPDAWTIHKGKLYLNYSKGIQSKWVKDKDGYIQKADENWNGIKN